MSLTRRIGKDEYLKKRIPKNAKYDHIKTRLDTVTARGQSPVATKQAHIIIPPPPCLRVGVFSRGSSDLCKQPPGDPSCPTSASQSSPLSPQTPGTRKDCKDNCHTARSTLLSVISGVGELNIEDNPQKAAESASSPTPACTPYPDCPYLLLDVRDRDQYDCCHIISAHSFPVAMLSRTMNPYTKEVLEYKNALGKIIIVYDEDERIASLAATTMCERGFENLFMLCGGLKVIAQKFPSGMTTGCIPASCLSSPNSSKGRKCSVAQQPAQAAEKRWRFTSDELEKIQEQMEEMIIPSYSDSHLSSRTSSSSGRSTASSRQSSSTAGRNSSRVQSSRPWK
ncbi:hypothetical protein CRENBAI_002948 [Crenichthys baileyi]|uniref:Rhodanese domain-containing protein n=1 Tax=Crenichthys baileyi TaxID=28760 RepID=A0AAV9SCK0_9TELE